MKNELDYTTRAMPREAERPWLPNFYNTETGNQTKSKYIINQIPIKKATHKQCLLIKNEWGSHRMSGNCCVLGIFAKCYVGFRRQSFSEHELKCDLSCCAHYQIIELPNIQCGTGVNKWKMRNLEKDLVAEWRIRNFSNLL